MTTKDFDAHTYSITIKKVVVDGETLFRGSVSEFPDVETYGETWRNAYDSVIESLRGLARLYEKQGRALPNPQSEEQEFSGRVTFRMPRSLHRKVAAVADSEGVSLNQFLVATIAERVGTIQSTKTNIVIEAKAAERGAFTSGRTQDYWRTLLEQAETTSRNLSSLTTSGQALSGRHLPPTSPKLVSAKTASTKTK